MRHISAADIQAFDKLFRLNLVNSLPGYKPANLIGTAAPDGATNLAIFSSVVHLGSDPPLLGMVTRPTSVPRHTYENIRATGSYTINHVTDGQVAAAHYTSANFPREESEFAQCGFTPEYRHGFPAPYVAESRISIGLRLVAEVPIELNGTVLLIGQVEHVYLDDAALQPDGTLDLAAVQSVAISGLDGYHRVSPLAAFAYARAGQGPKPKEL
ncbi:flavin reductase family protein [Hymenobacter busanensis]|uniref:Flavin reductase family protein n=1 Tax=Hymenobacter busanensis TaxID=2607656 RepID=A0A7L5A299_9BACT|nr:flavin reductase family protein [Hymenobacter busanensis]KAA9338149.1 flavin reductase family protein [Hymenobacter busanensis]QHJ09427.1 flavin oxidoreductase [Hymenobacter busanensis]